MTDETNVCDRCGDEYDYYLMAVPDDFTSITAVLRHEYEDLCKPCRAHIHPYVAFAGHGDVEPKGMVSEGDS